MYLPWAYTVYSYKTPMETWSLFTASDLALAVLGMLGLLSVGVVLRTASRNVDTRERNIRRTPKVTNEQ